MAIRITEDGTVIYENEPEVDRELFPNIKDACGCQEQIDEINENLSELQELVGTKAGVIYETASGATASFADGADDMPMKYAVVTMEPIQDLHGYDNPWPAGGSVNKLPPLVDGTYTGNGVTVVVEDGVCTFSGTTTESGNALIIPLSEPCTIPENAYYHCLNSVANGSLAPRFEPASNPTEGFGLSLSPTNRISPITSKAGITIDRVRFYISSDITISGTFSPMICLTDAVTPWTPYSNICPISGRTGVKVWTTGKNKYNAENTVLADDSGIMVIGANEIEISPVGYQERKNTYDVSKWVPCVLSFDYETISASSANSAFKIYCDSEQYGSITLGSVGNVQHKTIVIANTIKTFSFGGWAYSGKVKLSNISIEQGSTATDYEPYKGSTYSVNWETEAGTVYGGTLDVVSGKLVVDRAYIASYNGETFPYTWISDRDVYVGGTTPTTGAQVAYKLAEPIEYQLSANEVRTLLGENNIWSDGGDVAVEYPADTKMYIEKLTAPTEDDMIADHAISANSFFMVGNTLYRATTAIASGATITVGTNATKLSLSDALNSLS